MSGSFPLAVYLPFAGLWSLAAWAGARASVGERAAFSPDLLLGMLHAAVMLFFLRGVDDLKDLEHDRRAHPERPLASGRTRVLDVVFLLAVSVSALVAIDLALGRRFLEVGAANIVLSLAMAAARTRGGFLERHWVLEVVLVQPLNVLVTLHACLLGLADARAALGPSQVPLLLAFSAAILELEVARKTSFREDDRRAQLYSNLAGPRAALLASFALAALAAFSIALVPARASAIAFVPAALLPVHGAALAASAVRRSERLATGAAGGFLAAVFLALIGLGFAA